MGEIIVPGETPEAAAERQAKERVARFTAEVDDWKGKLVQAGDDTTALAQLNEKSEYWRDRRGKEFSEAGGGFDMNGFRLQTRTQAFQDLLDVMDPSGVLRKKYEILFNIHAKQFFEMAAENLPLMKEAAARQQAQAFMQQAASSTRGQNGNAFGKTVLPD